MSYLARALLREWEASNRRIAAKAKRPVGMMSFSQAMTPEGRAEFKSIFSGRSQARQVTVPTSSGPSKAGTKAEDVAEEAGAMSIWVVNANLSTRDKSKLFAAWNGLTEDERDRYHRMARACITASEHVKKRDSSL